MRDVWAQVGGGGGGCPGSVSTRVDWACGPKYPGLSFFCAAVTPRHPGLICEMRSCVTALVIYGLRGTVIPPLALCLACSASQH